MDFILSYFCYCFHVHHLKFPFPGSPKLKSLLHSGWAWWRVTLVLHLFLSNHFNALQRSLILYCAIWSAIMDLSHYSKILTPSVEQMKSQSKIIWLPAYDKNIFFPLLFFCSFVFLLALKWYLILQEYTVYHTHQWEHPITLNLFVCCSFFSHFLAVIYVIIVTVQYSARNTCWGRDFSAQASKELSFSARIALVLRVISACQTYLSKISTSGVRSKLDKQGFISNIQFCQVWKWYILRTALSIIKIFYWWIFFFFFSCQQATSPLQWWHNPH